MMPINMILSTLSQHTSSLPSKINSFRCTTDRFGWYFGKCFQLYGALIPMLSGCVDLINTPKLFLSRRYRNGNDHLMTSYSRNLLCPECILEVPTCAISRN